MEWLASIPSGVVRAHAIMYERIMAEEAIIWAQRFAVGAGWMKSDDRFKIMSEWERIAQYRPRFQTPQEQLEIVKAITAAMGGQVPGEPTKGS